MTDLSPGTRHLIRMRRFWRRVETAFLWLGWSLVAIAFGTGVAHWIIAIGEWFA